jgi:hypothetical protein
MHPNSKTLACLGKFISPEPTSGCWLWLGSTDSGGYGVIKICSTLRQAHRIFYEMLKHPIPEGLELDHLCRVHCCVNPDHLEPVTHAENQRRSHTGNRKGNGGINNARKTHCPKGHPYDAVNTLTCKGKRHCLACNRSYYRDHVSRQSSRTS